MTDPNPSAGHDPQDFEPDPYVTPTLMSRSQSEQIVALLGLLDEYGYPYSEEPGWRERNPGYHWYDRPVEGLAPYGIQVHHTATSSYEPRRAYPAPEGIRTDGKTICNILIQPDGVINFVSADPANYSSGENQEALLTDFVYPRVRFHGPQSGPYIQNWYGNRAWINIEVVHRGDGSAIPPVQEEAVIVVCAFMCALKGWDATAVVGHYDGRGTKIDPRWDGPNSTPPYSIAGIQDAVQALLDADAPPGGDMTYRDVLNVPDEDWARAVVDWGIDNGMIITCDEHPDDWASTDLNYGRIWTLLKRFDDNIV